MLQLVNPGAKEALEVAGALDESDEALDFLGVPPLPSAANTKQAGRSATAA